MVRFGTDTPATQSALDDLLGRRITIPVMQDDRSPIPPTPAYAPLTELVRTGFAFSMRELLHSLGFTICPLPMNEEEAIRCAYAFTKLLYIEEGVLHMRNIPSDLQTPRSQELGIGVMCLLVHQTWGIPWAS